MTAVPEFKIHYDEQAKRFKPLTLTVRLVPRVESVQLKIEWESVKVEAERLDYFKLGAPELLAPGDRVRFTVEAAPGTDDEANFLDYAADPVLLTIKARPKPDTRHPNPAEVTKECNVRFAPFYETIIKFEQEGEREFHGARLKRKGEFVADSWDEIAVIIYARLWGKEPDQIAKKAELEPRFDPEQGDRFEMKKDEQYREPGKTRYLIRATRPLLYTAANEADPPWIKVKGKVKEPQGDVDIFEEVQSLSPRFPALKLWVVPGARSGISEAGAYLFLAPNPADALNLQPLGLKVEGGQGGPSLTNVGGDQIYTDRDGRAHWDLQFGGMTWDNVRGAIFKVKCALNGKDDTVSEAVPYTVNVSQNLVDMLTEVDSQARTLFRLPNPWFANRTLAHSAVDYTYPDFLRGPLWNLSDSAASFPASQGLAGLYVCGDLQEHVYNWLKLRRFGPSSGTLDPNQLARMNGIEIGMYTMSWTHYFSGFHLSGSGPDDSPYFIDPWWKQDWTGVMTWTDQIIAATGMMAASALLILALASMIGISLAASAGLVRTMIAGGGLRGTAARGFAYVVRFHILAGVETVKYMVDGRYRDYRQPSARSQGYHAEAYWLKLAADDLRQRGAADHVSPLEPW